MVVGAVATTSVLAMFGVPRLLAVLVALPVWIGLAVAQDHDERVHLAPDVAFAAALTAAVAGPPLRLGVRSATGPRRARPHEPDVFVLGAEGDDELHPFAGWYVEVTRDLHETRLSAHPDEPGSVEHLGTSWPARSEAQDRAAVDARTIADALRQRAGA